VLRQWSTLHPEFAFLPRKFKIAVTGAAEDRAAIGLARHRPAAAQERGGRDRLQGAGGRRHGPHADHRHVIREFLPWQQILVFIEAIVRVYNRYGRRDNMYKARIKILVKAEGQKFIDAVKEEFSAASSRRRRTAPSTSFPQAEFDRVAARASWCPEGVAPIAWPSRRASADAPVAFARWVERNVHGHRSPATAPSRCRSSAPAGPGRRHRRPDGHRRRPRRPLQPSANCA
jgi:sulfite reductase (NADPH) hemoprotein beta-component